MLKVVLQYFIGISRTVTKVLGFKMHVLREKSKLPLYVLMHLTEKEKSVKNYTHAHIHFTQSPYTNMIFSHVYYFTRYTIYVSINYI